MPYRDAVATLDAPAALAGDAVAGLNRSRGKYLLSDDRVIGVTIDGAARAYPVSVLTVHEIANDELAGRPIAVTYHWPCDSVMVFDRRVNGRTASFGVSGLVYNSNMLMYERSPAAPGGTAGLGGEPLWSQLGARAVSGAPARAGERLGEIAAVVMSWREWLLRHPDTTVIDRDPALVRRRYAKATPTQYFLEGHVIYPVRPLPPEQGPPPLARVVAVEVGGARRVYPLIELRERGSGGAVTDELGGTTLRLELDMASGTPLVSVAEGDATPTLHYATWFAWHAFHPDDPLAWR
jgi:hypothetical protein